MGWFIVSCVMLLRAKFAESNRICLLVAVMKQLSCLRPAEAFDAKWLTVKVKDGERIAL